MHPSVLRTLPTAARHRRVLTTAQQVRIAVTVLLTVAVVAALGVLGGSVSTQVSVLQWFSARGVSLALVGWAVYAWPLLCFAAIVSPRRRPLTRAFSWLALPPALLAAAVMGRPRGMTAAAWEVAVSSEFVRAIELTAYAVLGAAVLCLILSGRTLARPATAEDALIALRRNVSLTLLLAVGSVLATLALT